jgi:hypothetical protein
VRDSPATPRGSGVSLSRRASSAFMPPYWERQRFQVLSAMPRWRTTSGEVLALVEQALALTELAHDLPAADLRRPKVDYESRTLPQPVRIT